MKKTLLFLTVSLVALNVHVQSQVYLFPTDAQQRGYYNRPYERYEAEEGRCTTNGSFLQPSDDQTTIQSEASHQQAVQLVSQNSYVSWTVNKAGDGLTVRFSLPDNAAGTGTKGNIAIYAGNDQVGTLQLDSYWAWQYCSQTYPTNNPNNGPVIRMKFDEMHLRLSRAVAAGETLKIVKTDNNNTPYTIDFVELELVPAKVTYESLSGDKIQYDGMTDIQDFVNANKGKIIYFPEGKWISHRRIYMTNVNGSADGTQLVGAGMWYTEIYFDTPSDAQTTYNYRGIEGTSSNLLVEGLYINTINNQRYYNNNSSYQVGKGFQNGFGTNSVIRNCWVEHFECGMWLEDRESKDAKNLLVEHCRIRNNYADGINCCVGSNGTTIRYCSFRNNGDDDMASWSSIRECHNVTFEYCTAENNWRASSLAFFGGREQLAHHIYIVDALESGVRVNADFAGTGFSTTGSINLHDITMQHTGCVNGTKGKSGDFWGSMQGALNIGSTSNYAINNVNFTDIDILDSRCHAIYIRATSGSGKTLNNIALKNVAVKKAYINGIYFSGARGTMQYCNLTFEDVQRDMNDVPSRLTWIEDCGTGLDEIGNGAFGNSDKGTSDINPRFFLNGKLFIRVRDNLYDMTGRCVNPK